MSEAIIYITPICPYCVQAKALLDKVGIPYTTIDIATNAELRHEMVKLAGGRTSVPQVFIKGNHIGGFDDLYALYQAGGLKKYLPH
ncbi:MAG: Glutaredoxin-related protein [Alphaproteobacteria bacterium]|jgi:glutaredoxin 3|nr:Glutaredoxin-related protein [Alphaproteobacteria bacterium]MDF3033522.1 Glutaredoxin-related protein [Alphaproteobacteria bacterium]